MPSTYTLISSNVLTSTAASVTFSAIPSTYTDLVVRISARNNGANITRQLIMTANNDTATNYSTTYLYTDGTNIVTARDTSVANINDGVRQNGNNATANTFASVEIYIPSYTASQNKPISGFAAAEDNSTSCFLVVSANLWRNTAAITSLEFTNPSSDTFAIGSSFYLYGIKNS